ncbi:MAG: AhpC/TSA family protein [Taibaiella sp.]|nr:AhpC/TSA family protein [Taibaiella sp.]
MPEQNVILEQVNANDIITIVDSQRSDKKGNFEITAVSTEPGLYRLHFNSNKYILLSLDKGPVTVKADWGNIEDYIVNGSPASENLKGFIISIREHMRDVNTMSVVMDTLQARGKDSILNVAKKDLEDIQTKYTAFVERYADTTRYEPNAIFAARMLYATAEYNFLDVFSQTLSKRFSGTRMTKDYNEYYNKVSAKMHTAKPTEGRIDVGSVAPEIELPSPDGTAMTLSSLKGRYVLIEFWASWSKQSLDETPRIATAFTKYKTKNLSIFGVSVDNKKEEWVKAIKDHKMEWINCSDLKGLSSEAARLYGVKTIPFNFLVDPAGKVIARDLHGDQIEDILMRVIK